MNATKIRRYIDACNAARAAAGYDDVVTPVRGLPLVSLGYEDERRDLHGFSCHGWSGHGTGRDRTVSIVLSCYCGHELAVTADYDDWNAAEDAAFDLFVDHARAATLVAAA
jgi:hypothetical protein